MRRVDDMGWDWKMRVGLPWFHPTHFIANSHNLMDLLLYLVQGRITGVTVISPPCDGLRLEWGDVMFDGFAAECIGRTLKVAREGMPGGRGEYVDYVETNAKNLADERPYLKAHLAVTSQRDVCKAVDERVWYEQEKPWQRARLLQYLLGEVRG